MLLVLSRSHHLQKSSSPVILHLSVTQSVTIASMKGIKVNPWCSPNSTFKPSITPTATTWLITFGHDYYFSLTDFIKYTVGHIVPYMARHSLGVSILATNYMTINCNLIHTEMSHLKSTTLHFQLSQNLKVEQVIGKGQNFEHFM